MKRCYFLAPFIVLHCGCFLVNLARFFQNTLFYLFVECLCSFSSESGWLLLFIPYQNKKHKQTRLPPAFLKIFETFSGTCKGESISRNIFSWMPEMSLITLFVMHISKNFWYFQRKEIFHVLITIYLSCKWSKITKITRRFVTFPFYTSNDVIIVYMWLFHGLFLVKSDSFFQGLCEQFPAPDFLLKNDCSLQRACLQC